MAGKIKTTPDEKYLLMIRDKRNIITHIMLQPSQDTPPSYFINEICCDQNRSVCTKLIGIWIKCKDKLRKNATEETFYFYIIIARRCVFGNACGTIVATHVSIQNVLCKMCC